MSKQLKEIIIETSKGSNAYSFRYVKGLETNKDVAEACLQQVSFMYATILYVFVVNLLQSFVCFCISSTKRCHTLLAPVLDRFIHTHIRFATRIMLQY